MKSHKLQAAHSIRTVDAVRPRCLASGKSLRRSGFVVAVLNLLIAFGASATTNIWTGATDLNWSTPGNWDIGVPTSLDDALFSTNLPVGDPSTINNTVDTSLSVNSLTYNLADPGFLYHNTLITNDATLTIATASSIDALFVGSGLALTNNSTRATISGSGTLLVQAANGNFNVRQGGPQNFSTTATLDMSGLSSAIISTKNLLVGGDGSNGDPVRDRASGRLTLAQYNIITNLAAASANPPGINVGYVNGNGGPSSSLTLGATNFIYSDSGIGIGMNRNTATLGFGASSSYALFRNVAGTGRQSRWQFADSSLLPYSGNPASATVDFTGSTIDALVDQLVVGRSPNSALGLGSGGSTGTLTFDTGTLNVNTVVVGYAMQDFAAKAVGIINVNGTAQFVVNSSMQLGHFMAADGTSGVSQAILNVGGGSVSVTGGITTATNVNNLDNDSEINVTGGSLYVKGNVGPLYQLTLGSGTTNTIDLGNSPNPIAPVWVVNNLNSAPTVYLNVQGTALDIGTIQLIKYENYASGDISDFATTIPGNVFGVLTNNTTTKSIDLVITNTATFSWNGRSNVVNVGEWDLGITPNWKSNNLPVTYATNNNALFDDSAAGTTSVSLNTNITPAAIIFKTTTKSYSLSGSGALSGATGITKSGSNTVVIANAGPNTFAGAVAINAGTIQLSGGADRLPTNAAVTLANVAGATLDLNGQVQNIGALNGGGATGGEVKLGAGTLNFRGTAASTFAGIISGPGLLTLSNATLTTPSALTLSAANTFSGGTIIASNGLITLINSSGSGLGSGPIVIRPAVNGSANGTSFGLKLGNGTAGSVGAVLQDTIVNSNTVTFAYGTSSDVTFTNVITGNGAVTILGVNTNRVIFGNSNTFSGRLTVTTGKLRLTRSDSLGANTGTAGVVLGNSTGVASTTPSLELAGGVTLNRQISDACQSGAHNQPRHLVSISGTNTLNQPVTGISGGTDWIYDADAGAKLIFAKHWSNGATTGNRTIWLRASGEGESQGPIAVLATLAATNTLIKDGPGSWTFWATNNYNGRTIITNGTLYINGLQNVARSADNTNIIVASLGTLAGNGVIAAPPQVIVDGTVSPGPASNAIGTLTINNSLILNAGATCNMQVNDTGSATNDKVAGMTSVTFGGTLNITLGSGTIVGGEVFQLFSATAYSGTFTATNLPVLPAPLGWDTSALSSGQLSVSGSLPKSVAVTHASTGLGGFTLSGNSSLTNWNYRVLANTNVIDPLPSWTVVGNGVFANGLFNFTDAGATNFPIRFYRIVAP